MDKSSLFKLKKPISLAVVVFAIAYIAAHQVVKWKLPPEQILKKANYAIQKILPGAQVTLGEIDIGLGIVVSIKVKNSLLKLVRENDQNSDLMSIDDFILKIPIWNLLRGRGTNTLLVKAPTVHLSRNNKKFNWVQASSVINKEVSNTNTIIKKESNKEKPESSFPAKTKEKDDNESMMERYSFNVKVKNLKLTYIHNGRHELDYDVSKLYIKKLNFNQRAAIEIASNLKMYDLNRKEEGSFDFLIIGDIDLKNYLKEKSITASLITTIRNFNNSKLNLKLAETKSNTNIVFNKNGIRGKTSWDVDQKTSWTMDIDYKKEENNLELGNIQGEFSMDHLQPLVFKNDVEFNKDSKLKIKGSISISDGDKIVPNLVIASKGDLNVKALPNTNIKMSLDANLTSNNLKLLSVSEIYKGKIQSEVNFDLKNLSMPLDTQQITRVTFNNKLSGLQLPIQLIDEIKDKMLADKNDRVPSNVVEVVDRKIEIKGSTNLNEVSIANETISGSIEYHKHKNQIKIETKKLKTKNGELKLTANRKNKESGYIVLVNLKDVSMNPFVEIISNRKAKAAGYFDLKMKGTLLNINKYNFALNFNSKNGEVIRPEVNQSIQKFGELLPIDHKVFKKMDPLKYKDFTILGDLNSREYTLKKIHYLTSDSLFELKGKGKLFPSDSEKEGSIELIFTDKKSLFKLREKKIPVVLDSKKFDLTPNYKHTLSFIAKSELKGKASNLLKSKTIKNLLNNFIKEKK